MSIVTTEVIMEQNIHSQLLSMADEKYRDFISKLVPTVEGERIIGIRTPLLRKFAKNINEYEKYLMILPHKYFEEDNLHAFLIERETDFDRCIQKLDMFLPYVDNWATCDGMKPPILKKEPQKLLIHIKKWLGHNSTYTVRYAINLLMSYYLKDNFDEMYYELVADIKSDEYYINMMRAWYFATALAMQYDKTLPILKNHRLDLWTHNKTIQKATESYRITKEQKDYLRTLRKKR